MKKINKVISNIVIVGVLLFQPMTAYAYTKKETVYTNLDYTGAPIKTLVNNHLYIREEGTIDDETELKNILNINGNEKFKLNDQLLSWQSKGKDIFYQGTTEKNLPISVSATYYLDGEEKVLKEMLGKKGKVTIELNFTNNSYNEQKQIYTPFVVTVGTIIGNKENSNIEITNGKVVDTGTKNFVIGIASPGLYESTKIEELKGLNTITITYDTAKFSLSDIYIVTTPKLIEETDFNIFDKVNTLSSSVNMMSDSMNKIEEGAKKLQEGTATLKLGVSEISNNLGTALNGLAALENGSASLDNGLKQIIAQLQNAQVLLNNKDVSGSIAQLTTLKGQNNLAIQNLMSANSALESACAINQEAIEETMAADIDCTAFVANQNLIGLLQMNNSAIDSTLSSLTEISTQISTLMTELNTALNQVEAGASALNSGLSELKNGVNQLYIGSTTLVGGANALDEGMNTLSSGISTLNQNGIQVLMGYTSKIKNYSNKVQMLINESKNYSGYASSNAENTVFIYKMPSAKAK